MGLHSDARGSTAPPRRSFARTVSSDKARRLEPRGRRVAGRLVVGSPFGPSRESASRIGSASALTTRPMPPRRRPQSARLTPRSAARDDARDDEESWKRELRLALQGEMSAEPGSLDDLRRSAPKPEGFRVALTSPRSVVACLLAGVDPNTLVPREIPPSALPHPDRAYENRERENRERRRRALNDVRLRQLLARRSSLSGSSSARHRRVLCGADARDAAAAARRIERATKMAEEDAETLEAVRQAERVATLAADELLGAAAENRGDVETMGAALAERRAEEGGEKRTKTTPRREAPRTETTPRREAPRTETTPRREAPRTETTPRRESPRATSLARRFAASRDVFAASRDVFAASRDVSLARRLDRAAHTAPNTHLALASPTSDSLGRASRRRADAVAELERVERRASRSSAERRVVSRAFLAETRAAREMANASIAESSARVDAAEAAVLSALDDARARRRGEKVRDPRTGFERPSRRRVARARSPSSPPGPRSRRLPAVLVRLPVRDPRPRRLPRAIARGGARTAGCARGSRAIESAQQRLRDRPGERVGRGRLPPLAKNARRPRGSTRRTRRGENASRGGGARRAARARVAR